MTDDTDQRPVSETDDAELPTQPETTEATNTTTAENEERDAPEQELGADELAELGADELAELLATPEAGPDEGEAAAAELEEGDAPVDQTAEEPAATADQDATAEASATPVEDAPQPQPQQDEPSITSSHLETVQEFLGELKVTLVELADRPHPRPADELAPVVDALRAGAEASAEQAGETNEALRALGSQVGQLGERVEAGVAQALGASRSAVYAPQVVERAPSSPANAVLAAVALVVLGWAILFWIKADSPRLAIGTLVGANAVACCMLLARRDQR